MESTGQREAVAAAKTTPKARTIVYWTSPRLLSRAASVGMLFTRATHCEKPLEYARR